MISVIVPVYNEEEVIVQLHDEVSRALDGVNEPAEILYVNDGSKDRTLPMLLDIQARDPRVQVVELSRNWGHQAALTAGLSLARGEAAVMIDAALQATPALIPEMVRA